MQTKSAIIIGSGIAGMATAIRLSAQGFKVSVYEKNDSPGGKIAAFKKDGFHFDAGPSLFTEPQNIASLFVLAGEPMEKYFSYSPVDIACKYFYENGKVVNAYTDAVLFAQELKEQLNEQPEVTSNYLDQSKKLYENTGILFINHSLHQTKTWLNKGIGKALKAIKPGHLFQSLHTYNSSHFTSSEAVQLFDRFATYNGSSPYQVSAMLSMIPHLEQNMGVYYPAGGMISITNALYNLAKKKGVSFYFNSPVQRIIHQERRATGVVVNYDNVFADVVVSNADIFFTYKNLLNNHQKAAKILQRERSSSAVIFYWGMNKTFPQLQLHNIFFSNDYEKEFDNIFNTKQISGDPTVYINISSKMEDGHAPAGKENWFVMVNVPANTGQDWLALKEKLRNTVIEKISRLLCEDIAAQIVEEQTSDPVIIEGQTASYMGSLYGNSSNSKWAAFLRHPNFTGKIKGLYFCGGSVHPGGGIPLCLKSAEIVSGLIAADSKKRKH